MNNRFRPEDTNFQMSTDTWDMPMMGTHLEVGVDRRNLEKDNST